MAATELPSNCCRTALDEIAKKEGLDTYELSVTRGFTLGENYLGDIFRAIIAGDKKSLHLILKVALKIPKIRENGFIQGIYEKEAYVYTTLLPILYECQKCLPENERFEFAKLYEAILEKDEEMIVMEDMCNRGYRMLDRTIPFNYEQKTSIKQLIKNEPYEKVIEEVLDSLPESFFKIFDSGESTEYGVLIHGDSWNNNMLFLEKGGKTDKMVFVDWQLIRNAAPILDVSYVLMLSIDSQLRSERYNEMLDLYYDVLSSNVTKMGVDLSKYYPPEVYRKQVAEYMKFGLLVAFSGLPVTLADKEDAIGHSDLFESDETTTPINKYSQIRLKELFEDCVKFKII